MTKDRSLSPDASEEITQERDLAERRRVLGYIGQLLDLSNDIERNRTDTAFINGGGRMVYVFDETVFESFAAPSRRRLAISSQFIPENALDIEDELRKSWELYETQSTFIATELLFGEKFLSAGGNSIFMTAPHRLELANRVFDLTHFYGKRARAKASEVTRQLSLKRELLNFYKSDRRLAERKLPEDLSADIEELMAQDKLADPRRFAYTREAAKLLVESSLTEAIDQVHRLRNGDIPDRIVTLTPSYLSTHFGASADDIKEIRTSTKHWFNLFEEELAIRNIGRTRGSVWSDAESLAVVQWLNGKLNHSRQQVVFITTDPVMFDAYRRWDSKLEPQDKHYYSPFILRRALQYVPLINLQTGESDVALSQDAIRSDFEDLFNVIAKAVEICLLPFNLSSSPRGERNDHATGHHRSREDLSLRLNQGDSIDKDYSMQYFLGNIPRQWYVDIASSIYAISRAWQKLERIAIGSFFDHVHRRMGDGITFAGEPILEHFILPIDDATNKELATLIHKALDNVLGKAEEAYLPLARSVILEFQVQPNGGRRAPHTIWGTLSSGQDLRKIISQLREDGGGHQKRAAAQQGTADDLFMVASALMIVSEDWSNAERYAEIAERLLRRGDNAARHLGLDAAFIRALAMRYSIGKLDAHFGKVPARRRSVAAQSIKQVETIYAEANGILTRLIREHEKNRDYIWAWSRYARALAERAALKLFVYSSLQALQSHDIGYTALIDPDALMEEARSDLHACGDLFDRRWEGPTTRPPYLFSVELHYLFNLACSEVERYVFHPRPRQFVVDDYIASQREQIRRCFQRVEKDLSPLIQLELAAFFILCGEKAPELRVMAATSFAAIPQDELSLDRHVAQLIYTRMFSEAVVA